MASSSLFISYSSKDVKIAEVIENHLLENGFDDVWRDKSQIRADWSREIANALSKSDIVLLIWSDNSSESNWVKNEWLSARALGKPIQLIVISALEKLPKPLANLDAIVFEINENNNDDIVDSENKQKIINKLKEAKPNLPQNYAYNILPNKRNIPFDPNPYFTGRNTDLVDLYLEIIGDLSKLNYNKVGIVGIGGVGKTQLAVEFFYRYAYAFDKGIFWMDGTDPAKWLEQIVGITRDYLELEIPKKEEDIITEAEKNKRYFIEFQKYCSENGSKMLLLVDNIIDPLDLHRDNILFPGDPNAKFTLRVLGCNILFTTRRDFEGRLPNVIQYELEMLLPESAFDLLTKYRQIAFISDDKKEREKEIEETEYAKKIGNSVGYLPLAIVLVGGYLRMYSDVSYQYYYKAYIKDKLGSIDRDEITKDELATRHDAAVRVTFEPEWALLGTDLDKFRENQRNQNAKKIISILSLLPESAIIPKNRLIIYSGIEKIGKTELERPADKAFNFLDMINLVEILEEGKSVRLHPLLREFVSEKIQKEQNVEDLMLESVINLKKKYYDDFSFLVDEYARERGGGSIDSILDDFKTVLEWSKNEKLKIGKDDAIINSIYSLYKILEQESHNLRLKEKNSFIYSVSNKIDIQLVFAQQIHIRATDLRQNKMIQRSREFLKTNKSSFNILWARVKDKSAFITTLEGHTSRVYSVAVTPDGTKIVSGSFDKTIKVWNLASGLLLNTLQGHTSSVYSVAITPDSTKIVSGYLDNTIKVWDLVSDRLLNTIHTSTVESVAITPDGTTIVSGSGDKTIKVWDLASGLLLNTLQGHTSDVHSVAITPDGTKIVSGAWDKTIKVWDLTSGLLLNTLQGHTSTVWSVAITPDGTKIVSGSGDKTIKVWNLASGLLLNTLEGHTSSVYSVAITPDSTKIVSGSGDTTINVWDLTSGLLNTIEGHTSTVWSVAITPDGTKIVSGSVDKTIKMWNLASGGHLLNPLQGHTSVYSVAITPDGTKIVSGSFDKTVKVWDLTSGLLNTIEGHTSTVWSVAITPDGTKIVSGSEDKTVKVWDLTSGLLNTIEGHTSTVWSVAITPDGTKIVSGSEDKTVKVWDLTSGGHLLNTLEGHTSSVYSVAITPDSTKVVSGSDDKTIKVWDLTSGGNLLNTLEGHTSSVDSVAITPDGTKVVSGSRDKMIKVWDLASGHLLNTLKGHTDCVSSVAITPDSTKVVSGSWDKTVKVWDINNGSIIFACKFDSPISTTAISKKNNIITIGDYNGDVYAMNIV